MFKFVLGALIGAGGLWAWQSFGRDLLGMGSNDQSSYGSYSDSPTGSTYATQSTTPPSTGGSSASSSSSGSGSTSGARFNGESPSSSSSTTTPS